MAALAEAAATMAALQQWLRCNNGCAATMAALQQWLRLLKPLSAAIAAVPARW
jgi:hypothetical protein